MQKRKRQRSYDGSSCNPSKRQTDLKKIYKIYIKVKYSKELADKIIEQYATGNHTIQAICQAAGIHRETFYLWKKNNKSFATKLEQAHLLRMYAIGDLALSGLALLVQKHEYEEITTEYTEGKDGKPKVKSQRKTKKIIMPNPAMITLVLTNRMPEDWKQRQTIAHTGVDDGPISNEITIRVGYGTKDDETDPD